MTLSEARKILGLGPDDDPRPHLSGFRQARERIAEMVRTAPNETLALRYQEGLVEFDRALAAMREYLEGLGLLSPADPLETPVPKPVEAPPPAPVAEEAPSRRTARSFVWLFVVLLAAAGAGLVYLKYEENRRIEIQARVAFLERQGALDIENRRWPEAEAAFDEIARLLPGSDLAVLGRRSIEAGMVEEQNQFIGYWTGESRAAFEADRWDDAEHAARQVLEKFPAEKEAAGLLEEIASARLDASNRAALAAAREKLDQRGWDEAIGVAQQVLNAKPGDEEARTLLAEATEAKEKAAADAARARELFARARAKDQGAFDGEILDWLREAGALAPEDAEIAAYLEKFSSYSRTLRVPGDFETPGEALAVARDQDRIVIAAGVWEGPLIVNAAVEIQGAGAATTVVRCGAGEGSAISLGPGAKGARVTGLDFRHESFDAGEERYSAALVRGGQVDFADCRFTEASGHGLLVIEGGHVTAARCRFTGNGWNGVAASGAGSLLEVRDCEAAENFGHGIESWDGAAVILTGNRCENNSRNGIHASNGAGSVSLEGNRLTGNREFGLVLSEAGSGRVLKNLAQGNLLGGIVIRATAAAVVVKGNEATRNQGPGIVLEYGLSQSAYEENLSNRNAGQQVLTGTNLAPPEEPAPVSEPLPDAVDPP